MRISDLMACRVVDETGRSGGPVRDIRITRHPPADGEGLGPFRIAGVVMGGGRIAHAWGFAEGRATGPWLLRLLTTRGTQAARFLPAAQIRSWGPGVIQMQGRIQDLPQLIDELPR